MADKKLILFADDDELICDLFTFALDSAGFDIITAHDVKTILQKIEEKKPDIMLLDLTLGDESGVDVLKQMKRTDIPVIMLSGYNMEQLKEEGVTKYQCVKDCLTKPVSPDTVTDKIKEILGLK